MGRTSVEDVDKIEGSNVNWFQLKNDGDTARVQFIMDEYDDIQVFMAHKVKPDGYQYDTKVDCLRSYNDPLNKCPLCEAGYKTSAVKFIGLYNLDDKKVYLWERGTRFIKSLKAYCDRYKPLRNYVFDIQRNGQAGSRDTTYAILPVPDAKADDISELSFDALGIGVREWTPDEMKTFINTGKAPGNNDSNGSGNSGNQMSSPARNRNVPVNNSDYDEVF